MPSRTRCVLLGRRGDTKLLLNLWRVKNYGVGILAAFDFSGRRPLVSNMPIPPGSARELDSPITRALLLAQATG